MTDQKKTLDKPINSMLSSELTFREGDVFDPIQALSIIEAYRSEWQNFALHDPLGMEYKPSVALVQHIAAQGALVALFGFDTNNDVKACYIGMRGPHPFNPEWTYCNDMLLYIAPTYRNSPDVFEKFMKALDKHMKAVGVDLYSIGLPASEKFAKARSSVLKNGFTEVDVLFMRRPE